MLRLRLSRGSASTCNAGYCRLRISGPSTETVKTRWWARNAAIASASVALPRRRYSSDSAESASFLDDAKRFLMHHSTAFPSAEVSVEHATGRESRRHSVVRIRHSKVQTFSPATVASLHTALQVAKRYRGNMKDSEREASRLVLVADGSNFGLGTGLARELFSSSLAEAMDIIMDDIETMLRFPVDDPTVAVVRGSAVGVAAEVALSCRELLLGHDATLQLHEHATGGRRIPPSVLSSYVWMRRAREGGGGLTSESELSASESTLLTRRFTAEELERSGRAAAVFRFGPQFSHLDAVDAAVTEQEAFAAAHAALDASTRRRGRAPSDADIERAFAPVQKLLLANPHRLPPSNADEDGEWESPAAALAQYSAASGQLSGDGDVAHDGAAADAEQVDDAAAATTSRAAPSATGGRGRSRRRSAPATSSIAQLHHDTMTAATPAATPAAAAAPLAAPVSSADSKSKLPPAPAKGQKKGRARPEDDDSLLSV